MSLPIYIYPDNSTLEITPEASVAAKTNPELKNRFVAVIINNSQQGFLAVSDAEYFKNVVIPMLSEMGFVGVLTLAAKHRVGERLRTDFGYALRIAELSIQEAVGGIQAQIPARLEIVKINEIETTRLAFIEDADIVAAVEAQSNNNSLLQLLMNQGLA